MKKKVLLALSAGVLLAACSFLISREIWSRQLSPQPFTATILETQYRPDSSVSWTWEMDVCGEIGWFRRLPSTRNGFPNSRLVQTRAILDLPAKKRVSIEPGTESTVTYPISQGSLDHRATMGGPTCGSEPEAEGRSVFGFETLRHYIELPTESPGNPTEVIQVESWLAPALSCLPLASTFTHGPPQGPAYRIEREVVSLEFREPPAEWFAIPSGYTERSPSEFSEEYARRFGMPAIGDFGLQQLGLIYSQSQGDVAQ